MGWQDAPVVGEAQPKWMAAPVIQPPAAPEEPGPYTLEQAGKDLWHGTKLAGRTALNAATGIPGAIADFGTGAYNLVTGNRHQSPTAQFNQALTQMGVPEPQGALQKGADILGQAVLGSKIPLPQIGQKAPDNFAQPLTQKMATLLKAQKEGYVVPPATTNPTMGNRVLEGVAGKLTTAQSASAKNQEVTNALAARALGLSDDTNLSKEALEGVRKQAGEVYRKIAQTGDVVPDAKFMTDIQKLPAAVKGALTPTVDKTTSAFSGVTSKGMTRVSAGEMLERLKELRFDSQRNLSPLAAQNPESASLGRAQKKAADALEELLMRHLKASDSAALADEFAAARQLIAKTHTVEKAFNESTGNVSATKLASALAKGKPLSGELKTAAQFGQAFPKAAREFNESLPGISPLDFYASGGVSSITGNPLALLYPFTRQGVREGLLSTAGQGRAVPKGPVAADPRTIGAILHALNSAQQ